MAEVIEPAMVAQLVDPATMAQPPSTKEEGFTTSMRAHVVKIQTVDAMLHDELRQFFATAEQWLTSQTKSSEPPLALLATQGKASSQDDQFKSIHFGEKLKAPETHSKATDDLVPVREKGAEEKAVVDRCGSNVSNLSASSVTTLDYLSTVQVKSDEEDSFADPLGKRPDAGRQRTSAERSMAAPRKSLFAGANDIEEQQHKRMAEAISGYKEQHHLPQVTKVTTTQRVRVVVDRFLRHTVCESFIALCIVINSILVGVEVDYAVRHPGEKAPYAYFVLGQTFNITFAVEVALRMFASGLYFLFGPLRYWNAFDTLLVFSSLVEFVLDMWMQAASADVHSMRMIRLIRITRILRVIRVARIVRLLMALRLLVVQIVGTLRACFWALVLLVLILYTFGMVFAQVCSEAISQGIVDTSIKYDGVSPIPFYWGSVPRSMYTLYKSVSGGVDWEEVVHPLSDISWVWVFVFNIFLAFTVFAVLNVVVGVFCQSAIQSAAQDYENTIRLRIQVKTEFMRKVDDLFLQIDESGDGNVTYKELEDHLDSDQVCAYFEELGLDPTDAWDLFKLLDKDGSTLINRHEFIEGCLRLKGNAKVIDVEKLQYENRHMRKRLWAFIKQTEESIKRIEKAVAPAKVKEPKLKTEGLVQLTSLGMVYL